jgi:hypothetical protein
MKILYNMVKYILRIPAQKLYPLRKDTKDRARRDVFEF